jgi:hypothetical protein
MAMDTKKALAAIRMLRNAERYGVYAAQRDLDARRGARVIGGEAQVSVPREVTSSQIAEARAYLATLTGLQLFELIEQRHGGI